MAHNWVERRLPDGQVIQVCRVCGVVRRADDANKPCSDRVAIKLRGVAVEKGGE